MYKFKKAFTLAEILIAMLVLGTLIALIMPQFSHLVTEKRRQVTANSYMKVYTEIENAIEEYSLINYASPNMFVNLLLPHEKTDPSQTSIVDAIKPYLRIVDVNGDEFTLYDGTTVKVGKTTVNFDRDELGTEYKDNNGKNVNTNVVVFAYQRPNTFIAETIYTANGNTYFACKENCDNDEVFKLMSSEHTNDRDNDNNSLKSSRSNIEVLKNINGGVTPSVSKYEENDDDTSESDSHSTSK